MKLVVSWTKHTAIIIMICALMFISSIITVVLYARLTGGTDRFAVAGQDLSFHTTAVDHSPDVEKRTDIANKITPSQSTAKTAQAATVSNPAPAGDFRPQFPVSAQLDAPLILQKPELPRGCEITSLAMLLQFVGIHKTKMELLPEMKLDQTPIQWNKNGTIKYWGNPNVGFVGDITLEKEGFGIYHEALFPLLVRYLPTGVDISGKPFATLEHYIAQGEPVIAWVTADYKAEQDWIGWQTAEGYFRTTYEEHAVLVTGYDATHVYVNDPLRNEKNKRIGKAEFIASWKVMGEQALTYNSPGKKPIAEYQ